MFEIDFGKWFLRAILGFALMYIGSLFIGQVPPIVKININTGAGSAHPTPQAPDPALEDAKRKAHDAQIQAQKDREHRNRLAEIDRQQAIARAEAEAQQRRIEAEEAARKAEEIRRQRRLAEQNERDERARRAAEHRARNGGCDPGYRQQCMSVGPSGGPASHSLGCFCVPAR